MTGPVITAAVFASCAQRASQWAVPYGCCRGEHAPATASRRKAPHQQWFR